MQYLSFVSLSKWFCQPFSAFNTIDNAEILLSDSLHMSLSNLIFCHAVTSDLTVLSPGVIRIKGGGNKLTFKSKIRLILSHLLAVYHAKNTLLNHYFVVKLKTP